jgi:hypothetical protein
MASCIAVVSVEVGAGGGLFTTLVVGLLVREEMPAAIPAIEPKPDKRSSKKAILSRVFL